MKLEIKSIDLSIICDSDIKVKIDQNWTKEALINIVKNAYEHTSSNGNITIKCTDNPIYTSIEIIDTGTGISSTDIPHIFERFYKGKSNKESIGIGLNMAKKIIDMQSGDIIVISNIDVGTTFQIKLYKNVI
jgi:signal transduction histidine kinase